MQTEVGTSGSTGPPKLKQTKLMPIVSSKTKQHEINLQLTRSLVATNASFRSVDNRQFRKLVELLRPGTTISDRHDLAGKLLDEVYEEEKLEVTNLVEGHFVTLAIDGWSSPTNDPVIGSTASNTC